MKTTISLSTPAALETASLVAIALTHADPAQSEKDGKPQIKLATGDSALQAVTAELFSSGEVTGRPFETNLLHKPSGLKAKRLLVISGGGAKKFTSYELRRLAGTAARTLKARGIRSFALVAPPS